MIVFGVDDSHLSNKLQSEPLLTWAIAVQISRRYEAAKQAKAIAHPTTGMVESVGSHRSEP